MSTTTFVYSLTHFPSPSLHRTKNNSPILVMGVRRHSRHRSGPNQLPQPTRPILSYDTNPESQLPEERDPQEYRHPEALELPKPSPHMAMPSYDMGSEPNPHHGVRFSEPAKSYVPNSDPGASFSGDRIHLSPSTGKTPKGEKEAVDELLLILVECMEEVNTKSRETLLRKFFSEIEKEERLERFIVERLRQSKVKAIAELCEKLPASLETGELSSDGGDGVSIVYDDDSISTRSLNESVEELSEKLERFKVKTLNLGGVVVNEDEEKK